MTDELIVDQLNSVNHLVHQGHWALYNGGDLPQTLLSHEAVARVLEGPSVLTHEAEEIGVAGTADRIDRTAWTDAGWGGAFDFATALHSSATPVAQPRQVAAIRAAACTTGIVEHYPAAPTVPPLNAHALLEMVYDAKLAELREPLQFFLCVIDVDDLESGWYVPVEGKLNLFAVNVPEIDLNRIIPISFGRAGFKVQAVGIIAAVDASLTMRDARWYSRVAIEGGSALAWFEVSASNTGVSLRGNYAVERELTRILSLDEEQAVLLGAVAVGSR